MLNNKTFFKAILCILFITLISPSYSTAAKIVIDVDSTDYNTIRKRWDAQNTNNTELYGWGDHSLVGYLTSETDPLWIASDAFGISTADITNWDGKEDDLGNPSTDGYILSSTTLGVRSWIEMTGGGSALEVEDESVSLSTVVTKINFAGTGVTATEPVANEILVTIAGGAAPVDSVNGETGVVVLDASEINIVDIGALITATEIDAALTENRTAINLNTAKTTNVSTDLTYSVAPTTVTVESSDGTNAILPEADTTNAGILGSDKWDEIVTNSSKVSYTPAVPGAIGGTTPAAGTFTTVNSAEYTSSAADGARRSIYPENTAYTPAVGEESIYNVAGDMRIAEAGMLVGSIAVVEDITFETLNTVGDVGTAATQVSQGDHAHAGTYEPADATILKDADIDSTVQSYDADTVKADTDTDHTGVLTATVNIIPKAASYTLTATEARGSQTIATAAMTLTLPTAVAGYSGCLESGQGLSAIIQLLPAAGDYLVVAGVRKTVATAYAASAAVGNKICFIAVSADDWHITSEVGTWAE